MTKNIRLGSVSLAIEDYASQGNAVLGIRDSGKSYSATYMAERLMDAGVPIIAFDPIGVWRFLRVGASGDGYPVVVAGGEDGDLPLTPQGAPEIVRAAMRDGVSLVIDLYSMNLSKADWKRIVESCLQVMLYENKAHGLRHVFIEEASEFCPQRVGPDQGLVYAAVEKLARMGGNALLGYTLINQRAEEVNKAVLELCDNLFLHRQKGKNSLLSLTKWLDVGDAKGAKSIIISLPLLPQGECWVWAAGSDTPVHVKMPKKRTFHPDRRAMRGTVVSIQKKGLNVDAFVEQMKGSLAKVVEEAKANDPKALKARITQLEKERSQEKASPLVMFDPQAEEKARQEGFAEGSAAMAAKLMPVLRKANLVRSESAESADMLDAIMRDQPASPPRSTSRQPVQNATVSQPRQASDDGVKLSGAERKILSALAPYPQGRSKRQVALLTGYAIGGGGFNNAMSSLRTKGWMDGRGDPLTITEDGLEVLGDYDPLPTGAALLAHWLGQLGKAERAILETLAGSYPNPMDKSSLGFASGYEPGGGGFNNALSRLRTLELIEGRGELRASEDLF